MSIFEHRPWKDLDAGDRPVPDEIPIAFRWNGHAIPALAQIDERDWVAVLKTLRRPIQRVAVHTAPGGVGGMLYNRMALEDRPLEPAHAAERTEQPSRHLAADGPRQTPQAAGELPD